MKKVTDADMLTKELLKIGVTIRGLRGIWFGAKRGDYRAQRKLLKIISDVPLAYAYVLDLTKQYGDTVEVSKTRKSKPKSKKPTSWERAAATVGPEGVKVFRGGLPTLGRKK